MRTCGKRLGMKFLLPGMTTWGPASPEASLCRRGTTLLSSKVAIQSAAHPATLYCCWVLHACSHLVIPCKGCTSAYLDGSGTQGNTLAAYPKHTAISIHATATETGFIAAPALCCYGKTYVMTLIVPQDLHSLLADARGAHTLGNDL